MFHYFRDFTMGVIQYRVQWIEVTNHRNVCRVLNDESLSVFVRLGWAPTRVGYVRLWNGRVDTGLESSMPFHEYDQYRYQEDARAARAPTMRPSH
jgi:hypothetical protein